MHAFLLGLVTSCIWAPVFAQAGPTTAEGGTPAASSELSQVNSAPLGPPGRVARYRNLKTADLRPTMVLTYELALGPSQQMERAPRQWMRLEAAKVNGQRFRVWLLTRGYPPVALAAAQEMVARYVLQEGDNQPMEFRHQVTGQAVLPSLGAWPFLLPRSASAEKPVGTGEIFPAESLLLGHRFRRETLEEGPVLAPPSEPQVVALWPELLVGVPSNQRTRDDTRRYDNSDYPMTRLTAADYRQMVEAGINCLRVDAQQLPWVQGLNAFYWDPTGAGLPYPEALYRSAYLGPELFLDEPAVGTRDYVIRPRLAKDEAFRQGLTPQVVLAAFEGHFHRALESASAAGLARLLAARADVDLGTMDFRPANLFSWETMVSTAAYQLSQDPVVPAALVFEPPGRVGAWRTLPELDMTYGCQIPVDDPNNLTAIIYGFLRGAARLTDKQWGTSIYGAVDRADAFWFLTHAYDLGATRFFFWDYSPTACVPFGECLALARALHAHAENMPRRDLARLRRVAEVALLLPPGYNLGHVQLGKGSLWGLGELNLERRNQAGVSYRTVMANFFAEIERCLRLGVAFDLLWDLPGIQLSGYREVVRMREDGQVELQQGGRTELLPRARLPQRPAGDPPGLAVKLSAARGNAPLEIIAQATVRETAAPVYYTYGTDNRGIYHNAVVAWELYGPTAADYRVLQPPGNRPAVRRDGSTWQVGVRATLRRPGNYRLRAATVDWAGRTTVTWIPITVGSP